MGPIPERRKVGIHFSSQSEGKVLTIVVVGRSQDDLATQCNDPCRVSR
jgi:hypothetical protein